MLFRSHPKEIRLEERLRNRFEMGLITDIQEPDLETRIAILRKKAESEGILVPNEVTLFIAHHVKANIRELEGSMLRVIAFASLTRQEISLELVKEVLKDALPNEEKRISVDTIQRLVAERYNCKFSDMKSKKRTKQIAFPRQIAMYLSRELTAHSLTEIGAAFGGKDHTTSSTLMKKSTSCARPTPLYWPRSPTLRNTSPTGTRRLFKSLFPWLSPVYPRHPQKGPPRAVKFLKGLVSPQKNSQKGEVLGYKWAFRAKKLRSCGFLL